eukprot:CAMPEP_0177531182 /NCGR_PEP_ID=MMETSP0369-20130122/53862_1 /TAXON_ID=447022 ORGANISM="Scrippsiella hangoei-like, Strain SHHI-4" /NCGR_SAMPLE_ID=MMETSP0369 /ASSEMBLY_ACC=CAM_ASM_000364 /LENGTH=75 /DNA_ID=CAMNT_0019012219 /DNA_START=172 /DNA_END=396 /DNA_ORIENTATION=+
MATNVSARPAESVATSRVPLRAGSGCTTRGEAPSRRQSPLLAASGAAKKTCHEHSKYNPTADADLKDVINLQWEA